MSNQVLDSSRPSAALRPLRQVVQRSLDRDVVGELTATGDSKGAREKDRSREVVVIRAANSQSSSDPTRLARALLLPGLARALLLPEGLQVQEGRPN